MTWSDFSGKKVALLGAGAENLSLVPHLKKAKAEITICDKNIEAISDEIQKLVGTKIGDSYLEGLEEFDYLFRSPGLPVARVDSALKNVGKQPIRTSAMDLFFSLGLGRTVGVTGTKGKGTTSTMLGSILEAAGKNVIVAGNIGAVIFDRLDDIYPETVVVLELSSFQLEDISHSPGIAIILPIVPDHLQPLSERSPNFHPSFAAYAKAKANITAFQTSTNLLVYAADSSVVKDIANSSAARRLGIGEKEGDIIISENGEISVGDDDLIDLKKLGLRGRHVFLDAALALTVARELECDIAAINQGLINFKPLPHRLQMVTTLNGVTFVDDSYATAPDATIAAIDSFDNPIVWIGGGSRKGVDFTELAEVIASSTIKAVILLGEEAERIRVAIEKVKPDLPILDAGSMEEAVILAKERSVAGDIVLLSPACASKDMFRDAADRGDQFQKAIKEN